MTFDATTPAGIRALERLGTEKIGWLTTVTPDGQPQASAIWFLWEEGELLIYSHRRALRNGNIEENPKVAFNLHTDAGGDDYVSMEGTARVASDHPVSSKVEAYQAKYLAMIQAYGWTPEYFDAEYPVPLRITPTRWRLG
jgi:PPOX class probable F420-dependent enzyme